MKTLPQSAFQKLWSQPKPITFKSWPVSSAGTACQASVSSGFPSVVAESWQQMWQSWSAPWSLTQMCFSCTQEQALANPKMCTMLLPLWILFELPYPHAARVPASSWSSCQVVPAHTPAKEHTTSGLSLLYRIISYSTSSCMVRSSTYTSSSYLHRKRTMFCQINEAEFVMCMQLFHSVNCGLFCQCGVQATALTFSHFLSLSTLYNMEQPPLKRTQDCKTVPNVQREKNSLLHNQTSI